MASVGHKFPQPSTEVKGRGTNHPNYKTYRIRISLCKINDRTFTPNSIGLKEEWQKGKLCDCFFLTKKYDFWTEKATKRRLFWRKGLYKTQVA